MIAAAVAKMASIVKPHIETLSIVNIVGGIERISLINLRTEQPIRGRLWKRLVEAKSIRGAANDSQNIVLASENRSAFVELGR